MGQRAIPLSPSFVMAVSAMLRVVMGQRASSFKPVFVKGVPAMLRAVMGQRDSSFRPLSVIAVHLHKQRSTIVQTSGDLFQALVGYGGAGDVESGNGAPRNFFHAIVTNRGGAHAQIQIRDQTAGDFFQALVRDGTALEYVERSNGAARYLLQPPVM